MKSRGHTSSPTPPRLISKGFQAIHRNRQLTRHRIRCKSLPILPSEEVDSFDFFPTVEGRIAHSHLDRLMAEHFLDLRHVQFRLNQPRSHRRLLVMQADVRQFCSQNGTSEGLIDGMIPKVTIVSALYFTRPRDGCQALCEWHRSGLTPLRIGRTHDECSAASVNVMPRQHQEIRLPKARVQSGSHHIPQVLIATGRQSSFLSLTQHPNAP